MTWLRRAQLELYPFPHAVVHDALPPAEYRGLSDTFPRELIAAKATQENQRVDLHAREALHADISGLWQEFIRRHTSAPFWADVRALFGDVIAFYYPQLRDLEKWTTGVRGASKSFLQMECQPGVNTPTTVRSRVRGPHLDNPIELWAGMLYMGEGEGDLVLYRLTAQPQFYGKLEIDDRCVEAVKTVRYSSNTAVFFMNSPVSVHGVTPRGPDPGFRRLVNFAGELAEPLFHVGHGRY